MRFIWKLVAFKRAMQLGREFKEVDKIIGGLNVPGRQQLAQLTLKEFAAAAKTEFPHLYGTPAEERYNAWGTGTDIGLSRARSDNPHVRIRGLALWLTVAYHETRGSTLGALDEVHRSVLRTLRLLKEWAPAETRQGQRQAA